MVRVALLFLVAAALAVLVLSNLSPVALTILGTKTLALPLGVWVAGAIGAGALTTVLLSGLFRLSRPTSTSASPRRPNPRVADRFGASSFRSPWGSASKDTQTTTSQSYKSTTTSTRRSGDDWETSPQAKEVWEDWGDYPNLSDRQPDRRYETSANIRDTEDDDWANWEGYEELERPNRSNREDLEDDFEFEREDRSAREVPPRTDFEVKREPETRQQSGSVYSYSYRRSDDPPEPAKPTAKPGEVYDADYRVITPPYHPDPEEVLRPPDRSTEIRDSNFANNNFGDSSFSNSDNDDDDWGLDDEPDDRDDRSGR